MKIVQPPEWPQPRGYSHAVIAGGQVHVAGQVGWNAECQFETDEFVGQARQALDNIRTVLQAAGTDPSRIVRLTWYVISKDEYFADREGLGAAYRSVMGRHYPPMTVVEVKGLTARRAKVEIEATAVLP